MRLTRADVEGIKPTLDAMFRNYNSVATTKLAFNLACKVIAGDEQAETADEWVATFIDDARARLAEKDGGNANDA